MLTGLFLVLDALFVALTLLPLLPFQHWLVRDPEFARLQIAIMLLALLLGQQILHVPDVSMFWFIQALLFGCFAYQLVWIIPYTPVYRKEVKAAGRPLDGTRCVSVLAANVLMSNRNVSRLGELVREMDPDIVLLLEPDQWWQQQMQWLRATHPHGLDCALSNRYGMLLYSRLALENPELEFLVEPGVPSMHVGVLLRSGDRIRLHALHPAPPSPSENDTSKERDAEVLVIGRAIGKDPARRIVTGDFNDVAWSPTTRMFRKISRLLDPRLGRGMFNTFDARVPLLRFPVDHVFHSNDFTLADLRVLPRFGSDHLPIYYRLQYEPSARMEQEAPAADGEDGRQADDRIDEEGARPEDVPLKLEPLMSLQKATRLR